VLDLSSYPFTVRREGAVPKADLLKCLLSKENPSERIKKD
jgi:hypothetical protein